MQGYSFDNLEIYLVEHNYQILSRYTCDSICRWVRIQCKATGSDFMLSLGKKYQMHCTDGLEIVPFIDIDDRSHKSFGSTVYEKIDAADVDDKYLDPTDADRLIEHYSLIDIDADAADLLRTNINSYYAQLYRLKHCTLNIKYKLCITSESSISVVTRANKIECFARTGISPVQSEDREMCIVVDLEHFFDKVKTIHIELKHVYDNLFSILGSAHRKQCTAVVSRIKSLSNVDVLLHRKLQRSREYQSSIDTTIDVISRATHRETQLEREIKLVEMSSDAFTTLNRAHRTQQLREKYNKLIKFKSDSIVLVRELQLEYNNYMLDFDNSLYNSMACFNTISENLGLIGVLRDIKRY